MPHLEFHRNIRQIIFEFHTNDLRPSKQSSISNNTIWNIVMLVCIFSFNIFKSSETKN